MAIYMFHGACTGCTQQEINGVDFCVGCCNFDADWDLPDLNNAPPTQADLKRAEINRRLDTMSAFDIYISKVETWLGRFITEQERQFVMERYTDGWHPRRTADALRGGGKQ